MADDIMTKDQHMAAHGQGQSKRAEWEAAQLSVSPMTRAKIRADAIGLTRIVTDALHAEHGSCIDMDNDQCETIWAAIAVYMAAHQPKS